jgi:Flp pilus assembly protein TadD
MRGCLGMVLLCLALMPAAVQAVYNEPGEAAPVGDADFDAGFRAIKAQQWDEAARHLALAARRHPRSADVFNLLGFAHRKLGDLPASFRHYHRALDIDPAHRGAHEYIGEAWLMQGNVARARQHLRELEVLCKADCAEYRELEQAIRAFEARTAAPR